MLRNFFTYLSPSRHADDVVKQGLMAVWRDTVLQSILNVMAAAVVLGAIPAVLALGDPRWSSTVTVFLVVGVALWGAAFTRSLPHFTRAGIAAGFPLGFGIYLSATQGITLLTALMMLLGLVAAVFLFNRLISVLVSLPFVALFYFTLSASGSVPQITSLTSTVAFMVLILITSIISGMMREYAEKQVLREITLTDEVRAFQSGLERSVQMRTAEISRQLTQYEVAAQIAREASNTDNLDGLLQSAVTLIRDRFGYEHAGLFLRDAQGEFAELRAATGEAGKQMLANHHRLRIGETGVVGYVVHTGKVRIASDVTDDAVHFKNPLLPFTRAEIALPLRVGDQTIGALDVQSTHINAFAPEDVRMLQTVADQLTIAAENARLAQLIETERKSIEAVTSSTTRRVWQAHIRNTRRRLVYHYRTAQIEIAGEDKSPESPQVLQALHSGQPVRHDPSDGTSTVLAIPIRVRGQVLGVVDLQFAAGSLVSENMVGLIENTVERLASSLENVRLLEDVRQRAERERLVSEITTKVRASSEVDQILRIAAQELGQSLGVNEVVVQLRPSAPSQSSAQG